VRAGHVRDLIVVGGGPAGSTAGVYAARARLRPLVFEGTQFGGAMMTATAVENYPGFPDGVDAPELMAQMRAQAVHLGAELRTEDVDELDLTGPVKTVTAHGQRHTSRAVILSMGAAPRHLNVPGERELRGRGVSTCATHDGPLFRDDHVAVVGGGDSAMEQALFLTTFARSVTIIHHRDEFRASPIMLARAQASDTIRWRPNTCVTAVLGTDQVTGLAVADTLTGRTTTLPVTGLFVAIGHYPRNDLVRGQVDLDYSGHVRVHGRSSRTTTPGVFAAGDLVDPTYRQAITAAGSGCTAAIDAQRWLAAHRAEPQSHGQPDNTPIPVTRPRPGGSTRAGSAMR
jgi:thioredoxin reductase (NADPH)